MNRSALRAAARLILRAGLLAVEPGRLVRAQLRVRGLDILAGGVTVSRPPRVFVVSAGKAAAGMAAAAHAVLGRRITSAIVVAPSRSAPQPRTRSFVAGHPLPDARGRRASRCVIRLLEQAGKGDLVLLLLSGGASALLPAPVAGVSLRDKQRVTEALLRSGAAIHELNAVRKQLSRLKGGGFARLAAPARVVTLALSDVPGDDVGTIGSGPTVEDPGARRLARRVIRTYFKDKEVPLGVARALAGRTPKAAEGNRARTVVIGSGATFARAAGRQAKELGFRVHLRPGLLRGEARECGPRLVATFGSLPVHEPSCLIATGETVVAVNGTGRGGRNQEVALASLEGLARLTRPVVLVAFATDGLDGRSTASGGMVDDRTARLAVVRGVSTKAALDQNDSNRALRRLGALVVTGPTGTNVADVTVIVG